MATRPMTLEIGSERFGSRIRGIWFPVANPSPAGSWLACLAVPSGDNVWRSRFATADRPGGISAYIENIAFSRVSNDPADILRFGAGVLVEQAAAGIPYDASLFAVFRETGADWAASGGPSAFAAVPASLRGDFIRVTALEVALSEPLAAGDFGAPLALAVGALMRARAYPDVVVLRQDTANLLAGGAAALTAAVGNAVPFGLEPEWQAFLQGRDREDACRRAIEAIETALAVHREAEAAYELTPRVYLTP